MDQQAICSSFHIGMYLTVGDELSHLISLHRWNAIELNAAELPTHRSFRPFHPRAKKAEHL